MTKRSLYQCFHARVRGDEICCAKGHELVPGMRMSIQRLIRGTPLELTCCQKCEDYDEMGPPIPKNERGWANLIRKRA